MKKASFIRTAATVAAFAAACIITATSSCKGQDRSGANNDGDTVAGEMTRPAYLKPGDKVAIITPAYNTDYSNITKAAEVIRSWGYEPVLSPNINASFAKAYAGTVEQRLSDLRWALENPDIKAIICQRGGYGAIHFIGKLAPGEFARNPKWLIGYSDITTLLGFATRGGVLSIHGPMGNTLAEEGGLDTSCVMLRKLLSGEVPSYSVPAHPCNISGKARGRLVGGNICTFAPLVGTEADFTAEGDLILFIEEVGESFHNLDRQLNILINSGILNRVKGVVLGDFSDCKADLKYASAEALLTTYFKGLGIPVCCGFPAGHGGTNWPLLIGADATLTVNREGSTLTFNL